MRARSYVAAAVTLVAVAGCADSTSSTKQSSRDPAATSSVPTTTAPDAIRTPAGQDAAGDLSDFWCTVNPAGADEWTATGTLTNDADTPVGYRVTVVVLGSGAQTGAGNARTYDVAAGDSRDIDLGSVRGPADGTCQVQVLLVS